MKRWSSRQGKRLTTVIVSFHPPQIDMNTVELSASSKKERVILNDRTIICKDHNPLIKIGCGITNVDTEKPKNTKKASQLLWGILDVGNRMRLNNVIKRIEWHIDFHPSALCEINADHPNDTTLIHNTWRCGGIAMNMINENGGQ